MITTGEIERTGVTVRTGTRSGGSTGLRLPRGGPIPDGAETVLEVVNELKLFGFDLRFPRDAFKTQTRVRVVRQTGFIFNPRLQTSSRAHEMSISDWISAHPKSLVWTSILGSTPRVGGPDATTTGKALSASGNPPGRTVATVGSIPMKADNEQILGTENRIHTFLS